MPHRPCHRVVQIITLPSRHGMLAWPITNFVVTYALYLGWMVGAFVHRHCRLEPFLPIGTSRRQAHTSPKTFPHGIDAYHSRRAQYKSPLLGVLLVPLLPWHHVHLCRPRKTKQRMTSKCSSKEPRRSAGYRAVWHSTCKTRGRCMGLSTLGKIKEPQALQQGASVRHPKLEVQALTSRIGARSHPMP